jgi:uncharacterized membrane protein (UPF0127 family)
MELAVGDEAIAQGLMGRTTLPQRTGMLFVFPAATIRQFWMAWCVMPIDLVFLDGRGRVVATWEMPIEPPIRDSESQTAYLGRMPSYPSGVPVRFAAEFPAGTIVRESIARGNQFAMPIDALIELDRQRRN